MDNFTLFHFRFIANNLTHDRHFWSSSVDAAADTDMRRKKSTFKKNAYANNVQSQVTLADLFAPAG